MFTEIAQRAFELVVKEEATSSYAPAPLKTLAVQEVIGMLSVHGSCLDLGGEEYTKIELERTGFHVSTHNLSNGDMHDANFGIEQYEAIFARHVLEHSAFPLYMLLMLKRALKPAGEMIVVVPAPETEWVLKHPAHVSVLPKEQWEKLFCMAGFKIKQSFVGSWTIQGHKEYRYLLV